jgi:hypothetical protein
MHIQIFLACLLPILAVASSIPTPRTTPTDINEPDEDPQSSRRDLPEALNFNGIDWQSAFNESVCTVDQRNVLL